MNPIRLESMFLTLDTSHGASVALVDDNLNVIAQRSHDNPRQHTEALSPLINTITTHTGVGLDQVTAIIVGRGPAPFTGLRVGLMTARALGLALGVEVYGVPVLAGIARSVFDHEDLDEVVVVTDARRREVYWATYTPMGGDDVVEVTSPAVAKPDVVATHVGSTAVRGAGVDLYPQWLEGKPASLRLDALARIALNRIRKVDNSDMREELSPTPLYLRRPDIHPGAEKKR